MTYNQYLQEDSYATTTIITKEKEVAYFTKWCKRQSTTPIEIDYKTSLKYIKHLTRKGNNKRTINHKLSSLKTYFNYLIMKPIKATTPSRAPT